MKQFVLASIAHFSTGVPGMNMPEECIIDIKSLL